MYAYTWNNVSTFPKVPSDWASDTTTLFDWLVVLDPGVAFNCTLSSFYNWNMTSLLNGQNNHQPGGNTLSGWYFQGTVLEVRVPWAMLGFTDPSGNCLQGPCLYTYSMTGLIESSSITAQAVIVRNGASPISSSQVVYTWSTWQSTPNLNMRKKDGFNIVANASISYNNLSPTTVCPGWSSSSCQKPVNYNCNNALFTVAGISCNIGCAIGVTLCISALLGGLIVLLVILVR